MIDMIWETPWTRLLRIDDTFGAVEDHPLGWASKDTTTIILLVVHRCYRKLAVGAYLGLFIVILHRDSLQVGTTVLGIVGFDLLLFELQYVIILPFWIFTFIFLAGRSMTSSSPSPLLRPRFLARARFTASVTYEWLA